MDVPTTSPNDGQPPGVDRRGFLMSLAAVPTLTIIGKFVGEGETAAATGAPTQIPTPTLVETVDLGHFVSLESAPHAPALRLGITEDGKAWFELPKLEMGQGISTTMAMIIAEELDARPSDVVIEQSDARTELGVMQFCAFSTSVRSLSRPLSSMAAAARARLVTAAAHRWSVPANQLSTKDSAVWAPDGKKLTFGELSKDAAKVAVAVPATPKPVEQHTVVGKPTGRVDARDIVTGKAEYISDTKIPGSVVAVVVRPPTIGGTVASYDDSAARRMPGVAAVAQIPSGIAVCAEDTWQAMEAAKKVEVTWNPGPGANRSDENIFAELADNTGSLADSVNIGTGDVDASFRVAFQSHAPMETGSAVADVRPDRAELWISSQIPVEAKIQVAAAIGLPESAVTVHVRRAGGSFGRTCYHDVPIEAAQISKATGKVVKVFWTRNDDMRHGRMGSSSYHRITASVRDGKVRSYSHKLASAWTDLSCGIGDVVVSAAMKIGGKTEPTQRAQGFLMVNLTQIIQYDYGLATMSAVDVPVDIPNTGTWRGVMSPRFRITEEVMADRLAALFRQDPVEFRLQHLKNERTKAVLQKVAAEGKWGRAMPKGHAQGIGLHEEHKSVTATLAEIDATDPKNPRVKKAFIAVDVGRAINPRGVEAQMQGGLMDGIATVLQAGLHIDNGAVREGSFADYQWTRQRNAPLETKVFVMPPTGEPGGLGDSCGPGSAAAVANAYARATGTSPTMFPVNF
ncbi:molybdopterin-dependent oxidoreductase [Saccharopolyspora sp. K220]|uniref:xanthine dehydrogenase family protein molybdopterin-binding subunit n=1 Tax=Saccharopolyspora soli TaxID=2926618 RepID=UPI001F56D56B|nr:molybdopterin cofactor-binding domain-containing protein [Saccharopolyspora soli]MCI2423641.1 molybdopterin-dependent oxidoreductase [Saccharopolyspora soli]